MDENAYSRETIRLLLERDKKYLSELIGIDISEDCTVDTVMATIYEKRETKTEPQGPACKKCNTKNVVTRQEQLRSADEGSTTVHKCESCGYRWY